MPWPAAWAVLGLALTRFVVAQEETISCGEGNPCPEETPCCSQYGQCGVGAYCLGGCDPKYSNSLDSCVPAPVCQSKTYSFSDTKGIIPNTKYLGDASEADWVSSGSPLEYQGKVLLTMPEGSVGTLLASTHYMWYGKTSAKLTTSGGKGVVTAFILMSDVKDEIDFEWVGTELDTAQTNFYSQGVTNYDNGDSHAGLADTMTTEHEYEIDWTPDAITWSIDGEAVRQQKRSETWNATSNRYDYPQTPARVQLSLWPAGLPSNGEGTIEWGGGLVNWDSQYMSNNYYYAAFSEVQIKCYHPPHGARVHGRVSYTYDDAAATNDTVVMGKQPTVLASLLGTGSDMDVEMPEESGDSDSASEEDAVIPGMTGAGPGTNGQLGRDGAGFGSGSRGSNAQDAPSSAASGFIQGGGAQGEESAAATWRPSPLRTDSAFLLLSLATGLALSV